MMRNFKMQINIFYNLICLFHTHRYNTVILPVRSMRNKDFQKYNAIFLIFRLKNDEDFLL